MCHNDRVTCPPRSESSDLRVSLSCVRSIGIVVGLFVYRVCGQPMQFLTRVFSCFFPYVVSHADVSNDQVTCPPRSEPSDLRVSLSCSLARVASTEGVRSAHVGSIPGDLRVSLNCVQRSWPRYSCRFVCIHGV
jgi:hypothetical protein